MKRKIFLAEPMDSTIFASNRPSYELVMMHFDIVDDAMAADILISRRLHHLTPYLELDKKFFIWTHEPVYNLCMEREFITPIMRRKIEVLNLYNNEIYLTPLFYFPFTELDVDKIVNKANAKTRECVFMSFYGKKRDRYHNSNNFDLAEYREQLAMRLNKMGWCDIFGANWPKDIAVVENSRSGGWQMKKHRSIVDYRFNMCPENTLWKNYVTEKLWDAISQACLPIYYSFGNGLSEYVNKDLPILCENYESFDDIYDACRALSNQEVVERVVELAKCWNAIRLNVDKESVQNAAALRFIERVELAFAPLD